MGKILDDIYEGWKNYIIDNEEVKSIGKERIEICIYCDYFVKEMKICSKCGCFMPAKVLAPNADCPKNFW